MEHRTTTVLNVPGDFSFWRTVYSHGWCALPPFRIVKEGPRLERVLVLSSGRGVVVSLDEPGDGTLRVGTDAPGRLTPGEKNEVVSLVRACLRLDEDLSEFHAAARRHKDFRWAVNMKAGRMLRAPTVFEDVVKMICTTNCSWSLTEVMVENLCRKLGEETAGGRRAFPSPAAVAGCSESFIRREIRAGYRAPYLRELARNVVAGRCDVEAWRGSPLPTEELFARVRSVKGVGPYAAGNILKLLGRYDYLGIDSWSRKKFAEIHAKGRRVSDRSIERHYEPFGVWKGLFFWLDMTKDWYRSEFPF